MREIGIMVLIAAVALGFIGGILGALAGGFGMGQAMGMLLGLAAGGPAALMWQKLRHG